MDLLVTVVPNGKANAVCQVIQNTSVIHFQTILKGVGTAPTEIMDMLSLGEQDKEIILSMIDDQDKKLIFDALEQAFDLTDSAFGVSFTVDISTIGKLGYDYLYQDLMEEK